MTEISFESAIKRLEEIAKILNEGNCSLKDSESLYKEGILLQKKCEALLSQEQKIKQQKITTNFEESIARLNQIVNLLNNECTLDDAKKLYEEGSNVKVHCEKLLDESTKRIQKISETYLSDTK